MAESGSGSASTPMMHVAPPLSGSGSETQAALEGEAMAAAAPSNANLPEAPPQGQTETQAAVATGEVRKRKPTRPPSDAWVHYKRDGDRAVCIYCNTSYACSTYNHGTSNLNRHYKVCRKNPNREVDKKQKTLVLGSQSEGDPISFKLADFSQDKCVVELAKMIVIDELPFKFVENIGFRGYMNATQPRFKIPTRKTIAKECLNLFVDEKVKLRSFLSLNKQMISLTTDTWTSIQNMNYMCVTAHFIDDGWLIHKRILSFGLIPDHKGETIGKCLEVCLKDWGIRNVCTITVDNASANTTALAYLVRSMSHWDCNTLLKGEFLHMRCCAHILNLIVCDGMKEVDVSIARIRGACKYLKSSPARLASFRKCAKEAKLSTNQMVVVDCPTRWNSTYSMLEVAVKYEKAFTGLEFADPAFGPYLDNEGGPPTLDDWARARVFVKFLKVFYEATLAFSGSLHVTSNCFFHKLCDILTTLNEWVVSEDKILKRMAQNMKNKFNKYWDMNGNLNYLLLVSVFLDPRYKLEYIDFCLMEMYGEVTSKEMVKKLKDIIEKLFAQYVELHPLPIEGEESSAMSSGVSHSQGTQGDGDSGSEMPKISTKDKFRLKVKRKQGDLKRNELERYLEDDVEDDSDNFDLLKWWKSKSMKYHVLSCLARDVLAIPISTVPSESAFSTGGRVLDPFRSSLHPATVEALICTQNWLTHTKVIRDLLSEVDEATEVETDLTTITPLDESAMNNIFQPLQ